MKEFEHAHKVLLSIFNEELSFQLAINNSLKQEKKKIDHEFKNTVFSLVGCSLRHYFVFEEIAKRKYTNLDINQLSLLMLGLSNKLFVKKVNVDELNKYIAKESGLEDAEQFISDYSDPTNLIPQDIPVDSKKYIHLRYNLTLWIVNMWAKNNGPVLSNRLYRSFGQNSSKLVRINTQQISHEEFFKKYNDFAEVEDNNLALHTGQENLRLNPAIKNHDALRMPCAYSYMCKDLDLDPVRGITIFAESENHLLDELYLLLGNEFPFEYICGDQKTYFNVNEKVKKYHLSQGGLFEAKSSGIITCVSKPVHTFFVCPKNSSFALLKEYPDYFLTIKQEDLDSLIEEEERALEEASHFVEDGGNLVYFVPTICKNEGHSLVRRFLNNHNDYSLVIEKQLFPFDHYKSFMYFAILRKEVLHD